MRSDFSLVSLLENMLVVPLKLSCGRDGSTINTILPEDPGSITSTNIEAHNYIFNSRHVTKKEFSIRPSAPHTVCVEGKLMGWIARWTNWSFIQHHLFTVCYFHEKIKNRTKRQTLIIQVCLFVELFSKIKKTCLSPPRTQVMPPPFFFGWGLNLRLHTQSTTELYSLFFVNLETGFP